MNFSLRDLLLVTMTVALVSGCMVKVPDSIGGTTGTQKDDDVRYYPPGPEFHRSSNADLPDSSVPAPNRPKP